MVNLRTSVWRIYHPAKKTYQVTMLCPDVLKRLWLANHSRKSQEGCNQSCPTKEDKLCVLLTRQAQNRTTVPSKSGDGGHTLSLTGTATTMQPLEVNRTAATGQMTSIGQTLGREVVKLHPEKVRRHPSTRLYGHDGRTSTVLDGPRPSRPPSVQVAGTRSERHGYGIRPVREGRVRCAPLNARCQRIAHR